MNHTMNGGSAVAFFCFSLRIQPFYPFQIVVLVEGEIEGRVSIASSADVYTSALFCVAKMLVGECPKPLCSALFQCRLRVPAGRFLPCDALRVIEDLHEVRCGFCQRSILHLFRDGCIQKRNAPSLHTVCKFLLR